MLLKIDLDVIMNHDKLNLALIFHHINREDGDRTQGVVKSVLNISFNFYSVTITYYTTIVFFLFSYMFIVSQPCPDPGFDERVYSLVCGHSTHFSSLHVYQNVFCCPICM